MTKVCEAKQLRVKIEVKQPSGNCYPMIKIKDKDKEALFNVAYNEQTTLAHELFCDITIIRSKKRIK